MEVNVNGNTKRTAINKGYGDCAMSYELIIFDLDGTLTDPKIGITASHQYALAAFGINEELENLQKFIGSPIRDVYRNHYDLSESDTERAAAMFNEYFAQTGIFENEIYPGIPALLQKLKEEGRTLAVATNKAKFYAVKIIEYFYLDSYFDFVSGDELDGSLTKNGKGNVIHIAIDSLDPQHKMSAAMIGDRQHDMKGANDNGIVGIGALWGFGSRAELESSGAAALVQSPDELIPLL